MKTNTSTSKLELEANSRGTPFSPFSPFSPFFKDSETSRFDFTALCSYTLSAK